MKDGPRVRVQSRAVAAEEPLIGSDKYDYADAFEVRVDHPDSRSAEEWARSGLEDAPSAVRWIVIIAQRGLLGLQLGPFPLPDHILGWKIVTSRPDVVHVEASSPLLRGVVVARRPDASGLVFTSYLFYTRPMAARVVWAIASPVHRAVARYLLRRAAAASERAPTRFSAPG